MIDALRVPGKWKVGFDQFIKCKRYQLLPKVQEDEVTSRVSNRFACMYACMYVHINICLHRHVYLLLSQITAALSQSMNNTK